MGAIYLEPLDAFLRTLHPLVLQVSRPADTNIAMGSSIYWERKF